jgi:hypothetical protein
LGEVQHWHYQRKPYARLTTNRRAAHIERVPNGHRIHCVCGGQRVFLGGEVRTAART